MLSREGCPLLEHGRRDGALRCHSLEVPYLPEVNRLKAEAAAHNIGWLKRHSMLSDPHAEKVYRQWSMDDLAASTLPDADRDGLELATDLFGFFYLFDDQFDGEIGMRPALSWSICCRLVAITHGDFTEAGLSPVTESFADLWTRLRRGTSPGWRARAARNWEEYFAAYPNEAIRRKAAAEERESHGRAGVPGRPSYLVLRRAGSGSEPTLDALERINGIDVPPAAYHSPALRLLRQYACDVPTFSNDVHSYAKEAPRGEVNNLVMVVQEQKDCSVGQASAEVLAECQWMIDQCRRLVAGVPALCDRLGLSEEETDAVHRYAKLLTDWIYGYLGWETRTLRYRDEYLLPAD